MDPADRRVAGLGGSDEPVRQRSLRTHNIGLVLRQVASSPVPVSRADVAATTGLTKATVSTLVDELLALGLVTETEPAPRTKAGRPAIGLRLASQGPAGLGVEVNVDYLATCVVDLTGTVRLRDLRESDQRGSDPAAVLDAVAAFATEAIDAAAGMSLRVTGAAVALPGLVSGGIVRLAPNLGWHDVDVRTELLRRLALPSDRLDVQNEANLAAVGELHARADADPSAARSSFLYISGEIGVGAGIVLDGQLFQGGRGFGGELGHVTIRPDGPRCRCGSHGCLEAYANQDALLRTAGETSVVRLATLAAAGAEPALWALAEAGTALGVAAADVVNLFDVSAVVLGGIYAPLTPWLAEPVRRELADRVLAARWAPVTVSASVLGAAATVVGAAGSVIRALRESPTTWLA